MFDHGKRPDWVVYFGKDGHDIAYDLTIVSPVRDQTAINRVLRDEQHFLATDEQAKLNKSVIYLTLLFFNFTIFCQSFNFLKFASLDEGMHR